MLTKSIVSLAASFLLVLPVVPTHVTPSAPWICNWFPVPGLCR